jgi:hypothetical protein
VVRRYKMTTRRFTGTDAPLGARVLTADGGELGTVKETRNDSFKIDAAMKPDYWLSCDFIQNSTANTVQLSVTEDRLDAAKIER